MLFSCWQKDTTTRPYRPYRAVLLFSNTKRRVILRMRSDAFQSACDAASTKNKRMATQTNAVKSLSDEVDFSLSGSKCTVSARFLHGFKTCKGCKSLQNRTKGAETRGSKSAMYRKEMTLKRNFQKLRESPGVRGQTGRPTAYCGRQQSPVSAPALPGQPIACARHLTHTWSRNFARVFEPMPLTSRSWSTLSNRPICVR